MIKLAKIFQDGMTFQRNKPCKVWGTSSEEKTVTIYMNEKEVAERELPQGDFANLIIDSPCLLVLFLSFECQ